MAMDKIGLGGVLTFDNKPAIKSMKQAENAFARLDKGADKTGGIMSRSGRGIKSVMDSMSKSAKRAGEGMRQLTSGFKSAALAGAPLALMFGASVREAMQFETQMAKINTLLSDQPKLMQQLSGDVLEMSSKYGIATDTMTEGMFQAISAGVDAAKSQEFMTVASKASVAGFTDMTTAVDGLTNIMNAYGLSVDEASKISDSIFIANKLGKTTFTEISNSIGRAAATAKGAGISYNELLSTVVAVTKGGVKTSEVMSGLKAAIAGIGKPTDDAQKEAKRLGINFSTTALKSKGFAKFLGEITAKTKGDIVSMQKLFGSIEAVNTVMTLTSEQGFRDFTGALDGMEKGAGATEEAFKKVSDTATFQWKRMTTSISNASKSFGTGFLVTFKGIFKGVADFAESVGGAMRAIQTFDFSNTTESQKKISELTDKYGTTAVQVALGVRDALTWLKDAWTSVSNKVREFGKTISGSLGSGAIKSITSIITKIAAIAVVAIPVLAVLGGIGMLISGVLVPIVMGLGGVFAAVFSPIGLIIAGAIAIVIILRKQLGELWSGLSTHLMPIVRSVGDLFSAVFGAIKNLFTAVFGESEKTTEGMGTGWKEIGEVIGIVIGGTIETITRFVKIISAIITPIVEVLTYPFKMFWESAKMAFSGILDIFKGDFLKGIGKLALTLIDTVLWPFRMIIKGVIKLAELIPGVEAPDKLKEFADKGFAHLAFGGGENAKIAAAAAMKDALGGPGGGHIMSGQAVADKPGDQGISKLVSAKGMEGAVNQMRIPKGSTANEIAKLVKLQDRERKVDVSVNNKLCIDGREVSKTSSRHQSDVRKRGGAKEQPWQRRIAREHGASLSFGV